MLAAVLQRLDDQVGIGRRVGHRHARAGAQWRRSSSASAESSEKPDRKMRFQASSGGRRSRKPQPASSVVASAAAPADGGVTGGEASRPQTTTFTRRPGTTMIFFGVRPSENFSTSGLAAAVASIVALSAPAGTLMAPRVLPLTCSTSSISSCTSAASTTAGQAVSSRSPCAAA